MKSLSRAAVVVLTLISCVGCDQLSKAAARSWLSSGTLHSYLADSFRLQLTENPGSFLSLGAALPPPVRFWLFTAVVGVLLLGLLGAALFASRLDRPRSVALGLIAGGGLSNLIDRLINDGRVTDFLNVGLGALRTGIFNVADMLILGGALALLFAHHLWPEAQPRR